MNVEIFIPCFIDQLFPETGQNTVRLLEKLGCNVSYNPKQTCCGQPAYNAGFWDESKAVCDKFIHDFNGEKYIVTPSGSCAGFVKKNIPELFFNSSKHNQAKSVAGRIFELSEFIVDILKINDVQATFKHKVTYHDSCGALRECGVKQAPRTLLQHVQGLELVEMRECETCCGFGGTFSVKFPDISIGMAQQKCAYALDTEAEYIVCTDLSCLMHIDGYIKRNNLPLKTIHIADLLMTTE